MRTVAILVLAMLAGCNSPEQPEPAPVEPPRAQAVPPGSIQLTPADPALRQELLDMMAADQKAREALIKLIKPGSQVVATAETMTVMLDVKQLDATHTARMKEIVEEHAGPGTSLVGQDGAHAAWILVQHADDDPEFRQQVLSLLRAAMETGEASKSDYALLVDRVRIAQGQPQVYASQFEQTPDGQWVPRPTEDLEHVDERRAEMSLPPLAKYRKLIAQMYDGAE